MITHAFTCTGPYAVLILLGIKRVENRSALPEPEKGRCAVSCSKSFNAAEYGNFIQWASRCLPPADFERIPAWADVKDWSGKIVGVCDYSARRRGDLVLSNETAAISWNEGYDWWWNLSEIVALDSPIPCRGNVGMWELPSALSARVSAADFLARQIGERIVTAEDAARIFNAAFPVVGGNEGFFVLPIDENRRVLSEPMLVSLGDLATTVVQPGEVFAAALKAGAKAVIVAHNHPSGDLSPSRQDETLTAELVRLGEALGVPVLDHLVLVRNGAFERVSKRDRRDLR